jgi:hypothetical protein
MGTQRQKTAEGHYLIRVKTEPDRATAPIPVLRQWQNTPGKGHTSETLVPAKLALLPCLQAGGLESLSRRLAYAGASIWRGYHSLLKFYTN